MMLKIHPLLNDPDAVFVYRSPVSNQPTSEEFERVAMEAMEWMQIDLDGKKTVLKPNNTSGEHFADPDNGITTHPAFVGGLIKYLNRHGARKGGVYIVEDPRNSNDNEPRHWEGTGFLEVAKETGAKLRCPNAFYCVRKEVPDPLVHPFRRVTRYAVDPETVVINVPKMKTHNLGMLTLSMKNLMGLDLVFDRHYCSQSYQDLPLEIRQHQQPSAEWMTEEQHELWQERLAFRLADLAKVIQPDLQVIEGIVGRDGTGFQRGRNFPLGLVVAGLNIVAVDSVATFLVGFDPAEMVTLKVAANAGLGNNTLDKLKVYSIRGDRMTRIEDISELKVAKPFKVIRNIINGDVDYQLEEEKSLI